MTKTKDKKTLLGRIKAFLDKEYEPVKNMDLTAADGVTIITIEREDGDPQIGDIASPDGEFVMPDGRTIIISGGVITEIKEPQSGDDTVENLLSDAMNTIENQNKVIARLKASAKTNEEIEVLNAIRMAGGKEWLSKACSTYKPKGRSNAQSKEAKTSKLQAKLQAEREKRGLN